MKNTARGDMLIMHSALPHALFAPRTLFFM